MSFWFCDHPTSTPAGAGWAVDDIEAHGEVVRILDQVRDCSVGPGPIRLDILRETQDLALAWGIDPAPGLYFNVHRTTDKRLLTLDGIADEPVVATADESRRAMLAGAPSGPLIEYYVVYERDPTTGRSRL